jgi:glycerophosphoryl diester phosphodiesterase
MKTNPSAVPREDQLQSSRFPLLVIAHRGASGTAPENTMAAFRKAILLGADMIELDVHLSRDGEVMVIHNDSVDEKTDGRGQVADLSTAALKKLDAGSWFSPEFAGEEIPTLAEVLEHCRGQILLNVEIKAGYLGGFSMDDLVDRTLGVVREARLIDHVLFSSFYEPSLQRIRQIQPEAGVALLLDQPIPDWAETESFPYRILNCRRNRVTKASIDKARRRGCRVNIWTVNDEEELAWFIRAQVDGIFTDYPERLIRLLTGRDDPGDKGPR